eukprot:scaffold243928_cov32-Tisochrysis_lutea.AAC.1
MGAQRGTHAHSPMVDETSCLSMVITREPASEGSVNGCHVVSDQQGASRTKKPRMKACDISKALAAGERFTFS